MLNYLNLITKRFQSTSENVSQVNFALNPFMNKICLFLRIVYENPLTKTHQPREQGD